MTIAKNVVFIKLELENFYLVGGKLTFFYLGFTSCKASQPLQGMELKEKEPQKD